MVYMLTDGMWEEWYIFSVCYQSGVTYIRWYETAHIHCCTFSHCRGTGFQCLLPVLGNLYQMMMYKRHPRRFTFVPKAQSVMMWMNGLNGESIDDLHHLGFCLGRKGTLSSVDQIRTGHDQNVKLCKKETEVSINVISSIFFIKYSQITMYAQKTKLIYRLLASCMSMLAMYERCVSYILGN